MQLIKKYKNPNSKLTLRADSLDTQASSNPLVDFATKWQQATDRGETSDPMAETRRRILDRLNNNTYYWTDTDGSIKQDYLTDDAAMEDYRRKSGTATPLNWEFNLIAPARFGLGALANGIKTGLQAVNTAFTPSTWLNPITGTKLLSPTVGTIADAGVQGAFVYDGLKDLHNQYKQNTLFSNPISTFMHGLETLPLLGPATKITGEVANFVKSPGRYVFANLPYSIINRMPSVEELKKVFNAPLGRNTFTPSYKAKRVMAANRPLNINSENIYQTYRGNDFDTFMKRVNNSANVVPTIKTAQGIEALASMSRGTTPVAIESEKVAPKVATALKSTKVTPDNTMSAYELRDYMSNAEFRDAYNAFAKKYGYKEMPKGLSREEMNKMAKDVIERHNTFYRGVTYQGAAPEDIESVTQALGHKPSEEEFLQYVATHPRPNENAIFVSSSPTIASMYGRPARIIRPYTLGNNRMNWFTEGDYTIGATGSGAEVINPWIGKYSSSQELANPTELLIPEGRFNGWFDSPIFDPALINKLK